MLAGVVGAHLMAACSSPAPSTPGRPAGGTSGRVVLPTYLPPNAPKADIEGGKVTPPGYTSYPTQRVRTVADPPASGGEISIITQTLGALPPAMDSNAVWQAVNKRVGATLNIGITPFADYGAKLPTILASNDMPDMLFLPRGQPVAGVAQFLSAKAQDLTPFLGGDAIKEYPNLAAHPTGVWKTTVYNNKIYGVGDPLAPFFWVHWHHQELLDAAGLQPPKNAADYKNIMQSLAKPSEGRYGIVAETGYQYAYGVMNQLFPSLFGAPNQWQLANGKLTRLFETDQFRQALEFARDLWAAGLYEPGASGYNTISARQAMIARKGVFRWDGNTAEIFHSIGIGASSGGSGLVPAPQIRLVPPFGALDGVKPTYPLYHGSFGMIVLKKAPEARIKELLRVLNFFAAPFGSEERELIAYGVEGRNFTRNPAGAPVVSDAGRPEIMATTFQNVTNPPPAYFDQYGGPEYVTHAIQVLKQYEQYGVEDPTIGFYSDTDSRQGLIATQRFGEGVMDIITGRRPSSELTTLLTDWRTNGGDQVRREYEESIAAGAA